MTKTSINDNLLLNGTATASCFLGDVNDDGQVIRKPSEGLTPLPYSPGLNGVLELHSQIPLTCH